MNDNYNITTFHSSHAALTFESLLKNNDIKIKIIPVPREISASCGLAGRFFSNDFDQVLRLIAKKSLDINQIYEIIDGAYYKKNIDY